MQISSSTQSFRANEVGNSISLTERLQLITGLLSPSRLRLIPSIVELITSCNSKDLVEGNGLYQEYFFGGKNPLLRDKFSSGDVDMFESAELIDDIMAHGNHFEANPMASSLLNQLIGKIVPDYSINSAALAKVYEHARSSDKSLVLLSNHLSHFDAPVLDYILRKE